jgi:tetratricopeptide (TPR) repeat protein
VERGLALAEGLPDAYRTITLGHSYLTRMLNLDGDLDEANRHIREIIELATGRADRAGLVTALYNESSVLCDAGRVEAARSSALEALDLARDTENDLLQGVAESAMAKVHVFAGESDEALAAAARGSEIGERMGQVGMRHHTACWVGYAHLLAGAPRLARDAFEQLAEINDTWPTTFLHRARGELEVGAIDRAAELARECLERDPGRMVRARALAVLGLAVGLGDPARGSEAEELICEAISLAGELGLLPYLAEARQFLADLLHHRGDTERAVYYAARAAEGFESCGMPAHADDARRLCDA